MEAHQFVQQAEGMRRAGGQGAKYVSNFVGQAAVVHSVVWEKGQDIIEQLGRMKAEGPQVQSSLCCVAPPHTHRHTTTKTRYSRPQLRVLKRNAHHPLAPPTLEWLEGR